MSMPTPTEQHRRLERLVGTWQGSEELRPSPWDPKGGTATATVENRLALDGFAVIQDYVQRRGDVVTFRGHGVITWDAGQQQYVMHWWDSMGFPPNVFVGDFDGDRLTLTFHGHQGDHRVVSDYSQPGSYSFQMDVAAGGSPWQTFMTGTFQRQG
jgi:hypothetical protein